MNTSTRTRQQRRLLARQMQKGRRPLAATARTGLTATDVELAQDKARGKLKPEDFTSRLASRFIPWRITLQIKSTPFDLAGVTTEYYLRGGADPTSAAIMASALWDVWEVKGQGIIPMIMPDPETGQVWEWPNIYGRAESERLSDEDYLEVWREAQSLKKQFGDQCFLYHISGTEEPTHWEQEKNPMAFVFYMGKPAALPAAEAGSKILVPT